MSKPPSAVFDCNVFLQAMLSAGGPANACWQKVVSGGVILFITPYMLAEIRALPGHKSLRRFAALTSERVERFIDELLDIVQLVPDPVPAFVYPRDPDDARYVDAAITTGSMFIVSNDKDLLELMSEHSAAGTALRETHPEFRVLTPPKFLEELRRPSGG